MSKESKPRRLSQDMAGATLKMLRASPRKIGLLAQLIRGKDVNKAVIDLTFCRKRAADDVKKLLLSAVANAENNHNLDVDRLYVHTAQVGQSLKLRRFEARGRGKAGRLEKPFCSVNIVLREREVM